MLNETETYWRNRIRGARQETARSLAEHGDWRVGKDGELELWCWNGNVEDIPVCDHCLHPGSLVARFNAPTGRKLKVLSGPEPGSTLLYNNECEEMVSHKWSELDGIDLASPELTLICKSCLHG